MAKKHRKLISTTLTKRFDDIAKFVNDELDVDIFLDTRARYIVDARALFYKIAYIVTNSSLDDIGAYVNRNHATVINGLKLYDNWLYKDFDIYLQRYTGDEYIDDKHLVDRALLQRYENLNDRYKKLLKRVESLSDIQEMFSDIDDPILMDKIVGKLSLIIKSMKNVNDSRKVVYNGFSVHDYR